MTLCHSSYPVRHQTFGFHPFPFSYFTSPSLPSTLSIKLAWIKRNKVEAPTIFSESSAPSSQAPGHKQCDQEGPPWSGGSQAGAWDLKRRRVERGETDAGVILMGMEKLPRRAAQADRMEAHHLEDRFPLLVQWTAFISAPLRPRCPILTDSFRCSQFSHDPLAGLE